MKKKILFIGILFLAMSFVACTKQDNIEKEKESTNTEQNTDENTMEDNDKTEQLYKKEDVPQPKYNGSYFKPDEVAYAEEIEAIKKHLKEKYDQDFEFIGVNGAAFMKSFDEWWFRPVGLNSDVEVEMIGNYDENGEYYTRDNYFGYLIKDEYTQFVADIVKDEFEEFKVAMPFASSFTLPDGLVKETALLDIYRYENPEDGYFSPTVFIIVKDSDKYNYSQNLEKILITLRNYNLNCDIRIYGLKEDIFYLVESDMPNLRENLKNYKSDVINYIDGGITTKREIFINN